MVSAPPHIEVESFEQVQAGPNTALLRVNARPIEGASPTAKALVLGAADRSHRLTPLPAPSQSTDAVRIAFAAQLELVQQATAYVLELSDGSRLELGEPQPRQPRAVLERELDDVRARVSELEQAVRSESERRERLANELAGVRGGERRAVVEVDRTRAKLAQVREALQRASEEAQQARSQLERQKQEAGTSAETEAGEEQESAEPPGELAARMQSQRKAAERRAEERRASRRAREQQRVERRSPRRRPADSRSAKPKPGAAAPPPSTENQGARVELRPVRNRRAAVGSQAAAARRRPVAPAPRAGWAPLEVVTAFVLVLVALALLALILVGQVQL